MIICYYEINGDRGEEGGQDEEEVEDSFTKKKLKSKIGTWGTDRGERTRGLNGVAEGQTAMI